MFLLLIFLQENLLWFDMILPVIPNMVIRYIGFSIWVKFTPFVGVVIRIHPQLTQIFDMAKHLGYNLELFLLDWEGAGCHSSKNILMAKFSSACIFLPGTFPISESGTSQVSYSLLIFMPNDHFILTLAAKYLWE